MQKWLRIGLCWLVPPDKFGEFLIGLCLVQMVVYIIAAVVAISIDPSTSRDDPRFWLLLPISAAGVVWYLRPKRRYYMIIAPEYIDVGAYHSVKNAERIPTENEH